MSPSSFDLQLLEPYGDEGSLSRNGIVLIGSGTFLWDSYRHFAEEKMIPRVCLESFWIDVTPVINAELQGVVEEMGCLTPKASDSPNACRRCRRRIVLDHRRHDQDSKTVFLKEDAR